MNRVNELEQTNFPDMHMKKIFWNNLDLSKTL